MRGIRGESLNVAPKEKEQSPPVSGDFNSIEADDMNTFKTSAWMVMVVFGLLGMCSIAEAKTVYVRTNGNDYYNGRSWSDAKQTVQGGLNAAIPGDQIWVATGTYKENITLASGAALYGGFKGTEVTLSQRNWMINRTILDGSRGTTPVVRSPIGTGSVFSERIDGFTIQHGNAGGVYCNWSSVIVANNIITGNTAGQGAGIYCSKASPTIVNCTITCNTAGAGAGIYCDAASPTIANCTIIHNNGPNGDAEGGGVYGTYSSSPVLTNNTITANNGSGVCFLGTTGAIVNTIVAFNSSGLNVRTTSLRSNCVFGNRDYDYQGVNPTGTDGNISADPRLASRSYGNVHIQSDSPCVDVGQDSAVQGGWTDLDGQARIAGLHVDIGADESDGTIWKEGPSIIVRVSLDGNDIKDGSSWASAKRTVQAAIDATSLQGGDVWVKAGSYYGQITLRPCVCLFGGFNGTETHRQQRDWHTYASILSSYDGSSTVTAKQCGCAPTAIDGFTIRGGNSNYGYGGGIFCSGCASLAITNNTITANSALSGGGIYCESSSPVISNNIITGNSALRGSGGIECGNFCTILNNTISGNSGVGGGGIWCGSSTIVNNTITGNSACDDGGGIRCGSSATIVNTIVAFNSSGIRCAGGSPTLRSNCVYGNATFNYSGLTDPTGTSGNISEDPQLAGASCGNLHLEPTSPCVDAGSDAAVQSGWTDMDGQDRIASAHVDIGADESNGTTWPREPYIVVRVSPDGNDANDGASWISPKRTVQAAINKTSSLGGEVWVKEGLYQESLWVPTYVHIYGGFQGTETQRQHRNWRSHPTILERYSGSVVRFNQPGYALCTVDGFTIRNGVSDRGGGVYCKSSSPQIVNNVITANTGTCGGGVYCDYSSPLIANNAVVGNTASGDGGGIYCISSSPRTVNNTIVGNLARSGGGIYCSASSPAIVNTIITLNSSGVYSVSGTPSLWSNCTFGNTGYDYAGLTDPTGLNGNISVDARLAVSSYGDVHIQPESPCVDAGDDGAVQGDWRDVDCQPRIAGAHVDIGADESDGTAWPAGPVIVRVSPEGDDTNDGSSWNSPKRTVQAAIDVASMTGGAVWVKAGTYPERITLRPCVHAYGGFSGFEAQLQQRDWRANRTVLDGQFEGSVVTATWAGVFACTIDGFTIRNGKGAGAAINCRSASPVIANNTITGNIASGGGSVVSCTSSLSTIVSNTVTGNSGGIACGDSSTVTDNTVAGNSGGGIACGDSATVTNNTVTGNTGGAGILCGDFCTITNNTIARNSVGGSGSLGGGIDCGNSCTIINNTITGNSAGGLYRCGGGGIRCGSSTIINNTITGNSAYDGGGIYCDSPTTISNTIIAFNSSGVQCTGTSLALSSNCVYGNTSYNFAGVTDPAGANGNISDDPRLASVLYGNAHLQPNSPCIDAGDDGAVQSGWTDTDGQPRITGARVDIGADESDGTIWQDGPYAIVRVSPKGDDANDGSSWTSAKRTVQAAIDAITIAGGEVWVEAGIYLERISLRPYTYLYGGFGGEETQRQQRDWRGHPTILDGQAGGSTVTAAHAGHMVSSIDGFTIRNGNASYGAGIYCSSSTTISNNTITGNTADGNGAVFCADSTCTVIRNNVILGNAPSGSSAIRCGCLSTLTIANNTITGNGGGIDCTGRPLIINTIVALNDWGVRCEGAWLCPDTSPSLRSNCVCLNRTFNYSGMTDPTGTDGNIAIDPELAGPSRGNPHIQPGSPCVDTGDDSVVQNDWTDIDGQPRIIGAHVDIGADESDGTVWPGEPNGAIRVSLSGDDANDGFHWSSAKRTVQAAIGAVQPGDQVWVAAGTYQGPVLLVGGVAVYGGFRGNEAYLDHRNWQANRTILDGGSLDTVVIVPQGATLTTRIDGFTIRNGQASSGGGIRCENSSPTITNNMITSNRASDGGGIACLASACPTISGNVMMGNSATRGGGLWCDASSPTVLNNLLIGNSATRGGGIDCEASSPTITNNTILGNNAPTGGGIDCANSSAPTVTNTIIAFNSSGLACNGSSPSLRYGCVYSNTDYNYSGVIDPTGTNGNISADPRFFRPATSGPDGQWATPDDDHGNLHLTSGSPCIDAGSNAAVPAAIRTDLAGLPRFLDDPATADTGFGVAPIVDMGAYEYARNDLDGDGDVDADDLGIFFACFSGPAIHHADGCAFADLDNDADVDQSDFGLLQRCFTGAGNPADYGG